MTVWHGLSSQGELTHRRRERRGGQPSSTGACPELDSGQGEPLVSRAGLTVLSVKLEQ